MSERGLLAEGAAIQCFTEAHSLYEFLFSRLSDASGHRLSMEDAGRSLDELGIDSIDGVLLTGTIGESIGLDLPPELFLEHRQISGAFALIAALLGLEPITRNKPPLIKPLLWVQGGAGLDGRLTRLASFCGDAGIEGVFLPWADWMGSVESGGDLQAFIEAYCDQAISALPEGPAQLVGYSQGGQLAFALAIEMQKRGRLVQSLVLLDSPVRQPSESISAPRKFAQNLWSMARFCCVRTQRSSLLRRFFPAALLGEHHINRLSHIARAFPSSAIYISEKAGKDLLLSDKLLINARMKMQSFDRLWLRWIAAYAPRLSEHVHTWVIKAESASEPDLGWRSYADRISIRQAQGSHLQLFDDDHIGPLSRLVMEALAFPS